MKLEKNTVFYTEFGMSMINDIKAMRKKGKRLKVKWYGDLKLWGVKEF